MEIMALMKWSDAIFHPTAQADVFPATFPSKPRSPNQQGPVPLAGLTPVFPSASSLSLIWVEHRGNSKFPCPQRAALIQHLLVGQSFPHWLGSPSQPHQPCKGLVLFLHCSGKDKIFL